MKRAESYRPLVEYAKEHGLAVIAAEAPTRVVRCVGEEGAEFLSRLSPEQRKWAAAELHLGEGPYREKFYRFLAEDGGHGPAPDAADKDAANLRSFAAQVTRDDTMAESIQLYLQGHPGHKIVHITGAFHVEESLGTVERLKMRAPNLKIAVVEPVEAGDSKTAAAGAGMRDGDLTLLLRVPPDVGAARARRRGAADRMEASGEAFHQRVAGAFTTFEDRAWQREHPECGPVLAIDADGSADDVESRVLQVLTEALPELRGALTVEAR